MSEQCQATTQVGGRCGNPAQDDGFCHIESHQPDGSDDSDGHEGASAYRKYTPDEVAKALRQRDGVVRDAAELLDTGKSTVYDYINEFDVCREAKDAGTRDLVDLSRATLRKAMRDGDVDAAKHVSRHYDDEAVSRQDVTSDDEQIGGLPSGFKELTTEELRALAPEPDSHEGGG